MGGFIPLGDASRPVRFAAVTALIIALNVIVFFQELVHGQAFVWTWSVVPIRIMHGHAWITLLTSMFMHAGWMHIIGNMVYLWTFGREIEQTMGPLRFLFFYLCGGIVAMVAQILGDPGRGSAPHGDDAATEIEEEEAKRTHCSSISRPKAHRKTMLPMMCIQLGVHEHGREQRDRGMAVGDAEWE